MEFDSSERVTDIWIPFSTKLQPHEMTTDALKTARVCYSPQEVLQLYPQKTEEVFIMVLYNDAN